MTLVAVGFIALSVSAREVVVREGQSLSMIAQRELGSMDRWVEIARLNNLSDPRRLQAGTRLRIPDDGTGSVATSEPSALPPVTDLAPHLEGRPSVRRMAGAVRFRSSALAAWLDLNASTELTSEAQVMTANTGRADWIAGDVSADLGPYSVLQVLELPTTSSRVGRARLTIGDLVVRSQGTTVMVEVAGGQARLESGEARIQLDEAGTLKITASSGGAQFVSREGQKTVIDPGQQMIARRGSVPEMKTLAQPLRLLTPAPRAVVSDRDVMFEWATVAGARGYTFTLVSEGEVQPKVTEQVTGGKIIVNNVPEGRYAWRVTPIGVTDAVASILSGLVVDRSAPLLELQPLTAQGGVWRLAGRTAPHATVNVGPTEIRADANGDFQTELGSSDGIVIAGVEARTRAGGISTRSAVAAAGRPMERTVPVRALASSGEILLGGDPAPSSITLNEGANAFAWKWMHDGISLAGGRLALTVDLTPPEITEIAMSPSTVKSGEPLTIRVAARDRGIGLGAAGTAKLTVGGPAGFRIDLVADEKTSDGVYSFNFSTPRNLRSGMLHVARLELTDEDGNVIILTAENMVAEVVDARGPLERFLSGAFLIGVGLIIGAL